MKKLWGLVSVLFVSSFIAYAPAHAQPASAATGVEEAGPESLLFAEIPVVYSASKEEQPLTKAPAVMTVYTEKDIKQMGARTLNDVMKRTVGFYPSTSVDWDSLQSRGIGADMNQLYLFLIDGHSINSINGWGPMNQHIFPDLSDVARIEIVRGPGSTVWGDAAVMGTINIITKEGSAIKGIQAGVDYTTVERQGTYNVLLGNETASGVNYMGSFTWSQNHGYEGVNGKGPMPSNRLYQPSYTGNGLNYGMGNYQAYDPSWEIYGKAKFSDFTFLARQLHFLFEEPYHAYSTAASFPTYTYTRGFSLDQTSLELAYLKQFDETMSWETKVFGDSITKGRGITDGNYTSTSGSTKYAEHGWGLDSVLRKTFNTFGMKHHLQGGIRINAVNVGPNTQVSYNADTGINNQPVTYNYLLTPSGVDRTYGVYGEDQVDITDKLSLVGGLRFIYNNFRDKGSAVIPRGALIYNFNDHWTAKYMYNSGDYLPSMNQSHRMPALATNQIYDADKSLKSNSNDFQVMYTDAKTTVSADVFHMRLRNFLANKTVPSGVTGVEAGYMNLGDISTDGIELDAHRKILNHLSVYGNYSYAKARMTNSSAWAQMINSWVDENGHMLDVPRHVYNLGIDWECLKGCNWNFHMRGWGWAKMASDSGNTSNTTFGWEPGHPYFDTTFLTESIYIFTKQVTFSVTCRNIFDSRGVTPYVAGNFDWLYEEGRTFDFRLTYKF